jgi:cAMP phosphodiesterase
MNTQADQQLLHLVIGGELSDLDGVHFANLDEVEVVGVFPNYASAYDAWKTKAQMTVDNAQTRYFIVHMHRLLNPDGEDLEE